MDNYIMMYEKLPNLVLGFHGCDISTYKKVLINHENLKASDNQYDWLGNGIYFWENSYQRACDWAKNNTKYEIPAGASSRRDFYDRNFCNVIIKTN